MKHLLAIALLAMASQLFAQSDSVLAGVYSYNNSKAIKIPGGERRNILSGSSTDLSKLEIHAVTLDAGKSARGAETANDLEKLILVKEGSLSLMVNDSTKVLGPAGYAVLLAGDKQGFINTSATPLTYYSISYRSRLPVNIKRGMDAGGASMKDWKDLQVKQTAKGESRQIFDRPSSMFARFDMHATALNPGFDSHAPHNHRAEEIILMIKGEIQVQLAQNFYPAIAGDVIFYPSNSLHAVKNTGNLQCGYFAIQWRN